MGRVNVIVMALVCKPTQALTQPPTHPHYLQSDIQNSQTVRQERKQPTLLIVQSTVVRTMFFFSYMLSRNSWGVRVCLGESSGTVRRDEPGTNTAP